MASPLRSMEWQGHPKNTPHSSDRDRCLEGKVGCSLSRSENRRPMVSDGKEAPHKLPGVVSRFVCGFFTKNRLCAHVRLRMDNTTAVAYVNQLGGTRSLILSNLALALWEWAEKNNIMLIAEHYAGHLNSVADWESRHFRDANNWRLVQKVFSSLMHIRGPCAIDLFADRLNHQLAQFYSWKPDPLSIATDALLQDWSRGRNYAFPPWYPRLLNISVAPPVLLPSFPDLLPIDEAYSFLNKARKI